METTTAVILVDLQNEWQVPGSAYELGDLTEIISNTNRLLDYARRKGYKIIFTKHIEPEGVYFAPNSTRSDILTKIARSEKDIVIEKHKISPFYQTALEEELQGIDHIVAAGILTNLCVRSLVSDAYDRDYRITVIKNCCKAMSEDIHVFTLNDLAMTRPEVEQTYLDIFMDMELEKVF